MKTKYLFAYHLKQLEMIKKDAKRQAFKIPLDKFSIQTMVWLGQKEMSDPGILPQDDCFDIESAYKMINTEALPGKTLSYFEECQKKFKRPLMFVFMPHIMTPDPIDISDCEIIEVF